MKLISMKCFTSQYTALDKQTNSVALVRNRTMSTERPPLVGEFCVNFC
jgi:hypothetical protein